MFKFYEKNCVIFPLAYNCYLYNIKNNLNLDEHCYKQQVFLNEEFLYDVYNEILRIKSDKTQDYGFFILDMSNINAYHSRFFKTFKGIDKQVLFVNIDINKSDVVGKLKSDLGFDNKTYINNGNEYYILYGDKDIFAQISLNFDEIGKVIENKFKKHLSELLRKVSDNNGDRYFLESSGVYSNTYINLRKLFLNYEDYIYVLYQMASFISKQNLNFDEFICSSKTGAILSVLLGEILNKDSTNCVFLGPKHKNIDIEKQKTIKENKKFYYIGDFACLGTEIKLINTLVQTRNSQIISGLVVSSYIDVDNIRIHQNKEYHINCLINVVEAGINYEIFRDK